MRIYNRNKNKKIEITRRDTGVFDITSKTYEMAEGDTATFTVKKYLTDTQPAISKTIHPQTNLKMTLIPYSPATGLPLPPSADGTYTLKATVTDGAVTYTWE